ncbi:TRAPP complex subunit Trs130 [Schizosaccharomyces cryophilus OY26]|uniref:TRAPP complex subunit Trs130 n=1 Tax=Schizosaccharomyces cryophilus (strain OY26 / ATCC MYA-4695 / CBS 11777 / NBRC 106824 / NRRL Y48691) TaxID=653667 RepID=S9W023_SCHCR|nr:TRAPP complex subunit Trs130 [Schizosaccharomyces cryophilus OY26]EPY51365.1 TRAPP complex subunit Trs130 [Schizosaccharomyces cryophilus OY26]
MVKTKPSIQYYDPFGVWSSIATDVKSKTPLRNLQWVESFQYRKHFITSLELEFVPWVEHYTSLDNSKDATLLNTPLVNMLILPEEDSETYKVQHRPIALEWSKKVSQNDSQSWMIALVARGQPVKRSSGSLGRTHSRTSSYFIVKSTIERLRNDFNTSNTNRCVRLDYVRFGTPDAECWNTFLGCLQKGVLEALDYRFLQLSEQAKFINLQDTSIFSDFLVYFLQKERLGASYLELSLYNESLEQFSEMFETFNEVLRIANGKKDLVLKYLGEGSDVAPAPSDLNAKALLLDTTYINLHLLLESEKFSLFHIGFYLFSKLIQLTLQIKDYDKSYSLLQQSFHFLNYPVFDQFIQENTLLLIRFKYDCCNLLKSLISQNAKDNEVKVPACNARIALFSRSILLKMAYLKKLFPKDTLLLWHEEGTLQKLEHVGDIQEEFRDIEEISTLQSFLLEYLRLSEEALIIFQERKNLLSFNNTASEAAVALYMLQDFEKAYEMLKISNLPLFWKSDVFKEKWIQFYLGVLIKVSKAHEVIEFLVSLLKKYKNPDCFKAAGRIVDDIPQTYDLILDDYFCVDISNLANISEDCTLELHAKITSSIFDLDMLETVNCTLVSDSRPFKLQFGLRSIQNDSDAVLCCNDIFPGNYFVSELSIKPKGIPLLFKKTTFDSQQGIRVCQPSLRGRHLSIVQASLPQRYVNDQLHTTFRICFGENFEENQKVGFSFETNNKKESNKLSRYFLDECSDCSLSIHDEVAYLENIKRLGKAILHVQMSRNDGDESNDSKIRLTYKTQDGEVINLYLPVMIKEINFAELSCELDENEQDSQTLFLRLLPKEPILFFGWRIKTTNLDSQETSCYEIPYKLPILDTMDCFKTIPSKGWRRMQHTVTVDCLRITDLLFEYIYNECGRFLSRMNVNVITNWIESICRKADFTKVPSNGQISLPEFHNMVETKQTKVLIKNDGLFLEKFSGLLEYLKVFLTIKDVLSTLQVSDRNRETQCFVTPMNSLHTLGPITVKNKKDVPQIDCVWKLPTSIFLNVPTEIGLEFTVTHVPSNKNVKDEKHCFELLYEVSAYTNYILFAGPIRKKVSLIDVGATLQETFTVIFLTAGRVLLPEVHVHSKDDNILTVKNPKYAVVGRSP